MSVLPVIPGFLGVNGARSGTPTIGRPIAFAVAAQTFGREWHLPDALWPSFRAMELLSAAIR